MLQSFMSCSVHVMILQMEATNPITSLNKTALCVTVAAEVSWHFLYFFSLHAPWKMVKPSQKHLLCFANVKLTMKSHGSCCAGRVWAMRMELGEKFLLFWTPAMHFERAVASSLLVFFNAFTPDQSKPSVLLRCDKNPEHGGLFFFLQAPEVTCTQCCCNPSHSNRGWQKLRTVALNVYHFKPLLGKFYPLIMSLFFFTTYLLIRYFILIFFFWTLCTRVCWCVCTEFHRDTLIKTTAAKSLCRLGCAPALRGALGVCACGSVCVCACTCINC